MRVFISSTYQDLQQERQATIQILQRAQLGPSAMEFFPSEPSTPLEVALRELETCDVVILLLGFKAGSLIPTSPHLTYTVAEFDHARKLPRPVLAFVKTLDKRWKNEEVIESRKKVLNEFKQRVEQSVMPGYFSDPKGLQIEILLALQKWDSEGRPGARRTFATPQEYFSPYEDSPAKPRLFDYKQTLLGREREIHALT